jgi:zinc protease
VVGDVETETAVTTVRDLFADWMPAAKPTGARPAVVVPEAPLVLERRMVAVPMMNKSQADVVYGFVGIKRSDPDYTAMTVMNNALGQYAIGGRLGDSIRERQGMAYYVYSSLDASFGAGPFAIRAGVAAANVERTIASIEGELAAVLDGGFTDQEVAESKSYMIGALPRQLETNAAIAAFLLNAELFGLGLDYDVRLPGLVEAVSKDAVNAAARRLLDPKRGTIAVAGPWQPAAAAPAPAAGTTS